jgi:3-oxoacyl-[acyl-carrier protein] reductase
MRLKDKVALITGGGSGIGEAAARRFAAEGAAVAIVDLNVEGAQATVAGIEQAGGRAHAIAGDVSKEGDVRGMVDETLDVFGGLHILVNNAAIFVDKDVEGTTEDEWDSIMDINVKSLLWTCKYAMPALREVKGAILGETTGHANIINHLMHRGGLRAEILTEGVIEVGAEILPADQG